MAALPQFSPGAAPGDTLKSGIAGENARQSWMSQAQERQIREQQAQQSAALAQRQQQQFEVMLPALTAKAVADRAASENSVAALTAEQLARTQYSGLISRAPADIFDAHNFEAHPEWYTEDGSPDWGQHAQALETLQAKYAPLSMLPEGKPYLDEINNMVAKAHQMAITQYTLQAATARAAMMANSRVDVATTNVGGKITAAEIGAGARTQSAETAAGARIGAAQTAAGATETSAAIRAYVSEAASLERAAAIELDPTLKETLLQKAQIYREKADALINQPPAAKPGPKGTVEKPSEPNAKLPTVKTQAEYDDLPAGSDFLTPSGQRRHKP